jgi:hypothetical protein
MTKKKSSTYTIEDSAIATDGGSLWLLLKDDMEKEHTILIPQYKMAENFDLRRPPGSFMYDVRVLIPRGEEEKGIVEVLQRAKIAAKYKNKGRNKIAENTLIVDKELAEYMHATPEEAIMQIVKKVISYIESTAYIENSKKYQPGEIRKPK